MKIMRKIGMLGARFLISTLFLVSSVNKIFHWQDQERTLFNLFSDWQSHAAFFEPLQDFFVTITPWTPLVLILVCLFELLGALLLLLGIKERLGAFLLILSLCPMTFLTHPFWLMEGLQREAELGQFLQNFAIVGSLLLISIQGIQQEEKSRFGISSLKI